MSDKTGIEWTDATWNPVRGCTKVSPGCKNCYAETFSERWRGIPGHAYEQGFDLRLVPEKLDQPLRWTRSRTIFVNSMSDLFHEDVPAEFIERVFTVMNLADWHTFQVLTKRPERMKSFLAEWRDTPGSHVWLGTSVEDRKYGVPRIEHIRHLDCGVRFLSIEPLLEDLGDLNLCGIDWVIVGGESGSGARPMDPDWVWNILMQCEHSDVTFFFKQWGRYVLPAHMPEAEYRAWDSDHAGEDPTLVQLGKKRAGRLLDGEEYNGMPVREVCSVPDAKERSRRIVMVAS